MHIMIWEAQQNTPEKCQNGSPEVYCLYRKGIGGGERCFTSPISSKTVMCRKSLLGPVPALIFWVPLPFFSVSFKKLIFPGCPLEFIIYFAYAGSLIFPTWYSPHLQMKFLSWAPEPCFQQCTEHLCQEAIWLSPVPSCQNIQNWACPTHSFLCLVSQISLNNSTINSASQARHLLYPDAKGVFSELHIRSQCCLLNSSVIPDHLWNYVQHLPRDRVQTQSGLAPSSVSDPEPLVSRFEPSFQRCAPLSLHPAC